MNLYRYDVTLRGQVEAASVPEAQDKVAERLGIHDGASKVNVFYVDKAPEGKVTGSQNDNPSEAPKPESPKEPVAA